MRITQQIDPIQYSAAVSCAEGEQSFTFSSLNKSRNQFFGYVSTGPIPPYAGLGFNYQVDYFLRDKIHLNGEPERCRWYNHRRYRNVLCISGMSGPISSLQNAIFSTPSSHSFHPTIISNSTRLGRRLHLLHSPLYHGRVCESCLPGFSSPLPCADDGSEQLQLSLVS